MLMTRKSPKIIVVNEIISIFARMELWLPAVVPPCAWPLWRRTQTGADRI